LIVVPRDEVAAVLEQLDTALGPSLLGLYLYGSAVDGGLRPDSDLDLLGIVERRLGGDERRAIIHGLLPISGGGTRPPRWRPVELTLVVHDEVRPWRYPPRLELQYGEWLRPAFRSGNFQPWPSVSPDLAVLLMMVIGSGEPVFGPPARELLDPVPRDDLVRAMVDELPSLLADLEADTRNVLLTLARMWDTTATGRVRSKDAAAAWALGSLPPEHRPLLARARAAYLGDAEDWWDDLDAVRALADHLRDRIGRDAGPLPPADASV
jgi:streptomycin 3"-adenylyltransferase